MVVMESLIDREAATVQKGTWYDHSIQAEEYLKASNNSYFSQMSSYHNMAHSQHGKNLEQQLN